MSNQQLLLTLYYYSAANAAAFRVMPQQHMYCRLAKQIWKILDRNRVFIKIILVIEISDRKNLVTEQLSTCEPVGA